MTVEIITMLAMVLFSKGQSPDIVILCPTPYSSCSGKCLISFTVYFSLALNYEH